MVGKFMNTIATSCKRQEMLRVAQVEGLEQALELGEIETGLAIGDDRSQSGDAYKAQEAMKSFESFERDQDIVNAVELIYSTKSELETLRTDDGLEEFLKNVTFFCMKHKIEVVNMDDGYMLVVRSKKFFPNVKNHHRFKVEMFLSIINRQLQELNDRFDEVNTELLICILNTLLALYVEMSGSKSGEDCSAIYKLCWLKQISISLIDLSISYLNWHYSFQ
ncbi:hypothetical protein EJB05_52493, partial [Eragrostis curvula]